MIKSINFEFVRPKSPVIADLGAVAEMYAHSDPSGALVKLRILLEEVALAIHRDKKLPTPEPPPGWATPTLDAQIAAPEFRAVVPNAVRTRMHRVRMLANAGAHRADEGRVVDTRLALELLRESFEVVGFTALFLRWANAAPTWREVPPGGALGESKGQLQREKKEALQQKAELEEELSRTRERAQEQERSLGDLSRALAHTQEELERLRAEGVRAAETLSLDETRTREWLIDTMLQEAGWDVNDPRRVGREVPLGDAGRADYVLYGEGDRPLGVVEAKRTSVDAEKGRSQAVSYADAIERMGETRPLVFLCNGLETWVWNGKPVEAPRRIFGVHSPRSVEKILARRERGDLDRLAEVEPDKEIAGRLYQVEAVKRVAEHFARGQRKALIVQATGTGKTRVAVALADVLLRANAAQRVLFLCDRIELRKQAFEAFAEHLPNESREVIDAKFFEALKATPGSRAHLQGSIFFATYPSMLDWMRVFDVGFFDLIIADESHRSIYNRYRDIFLYFDALQVGLTATPLGFVDRNTYDLFGCENQNPTFAYEFDEAVADGYLVPFNVLEHDTHFIREGVRWAELSDDERLRLVGGDEEAEPTDYEAAQIDRQLFIADTSRRMLTVLMDRGIRDRTDTLPGKTIVFARSHRHAEFLKKVFEETWTQYRPGPGETPFCAVIDSLTHGHEALLEAFKKEARPTIAISVDMLDTGVDVPAVVNLVFARPVRSIVKFWQMIGRGTRPCADLFGPGRHKKSFRVIDHWSNVERFHNATRLSLAEAEAMMSTPLRERLMRAHLALADAARAAGDGAALGLAVGLVAADLRDLLAAESLSIREHRGELERANRPDLLARWDPGLRDVMVRLAPLARWLPLRPDEGAALRFDLMVAELQQAILDRSRAEDPLRERLVGEADRLPRALQQVRDREGELDRLHDPAFWRSPDRLTGLETMRAALRGLMVILDEQREPAPLPREVRLTDRDERIEESVPRLLTGVELDAYRRRVKDVLEKMAASDPVLAKVRCAEPVTDEELEGLAQRVMKSDPNVKLRYLPATLNAPGGLARALRMLVGADPDCVRAVFERFVHGHPGLSAQQVQYLTLVQRHIVRYGGIERAELFEEPFSTLAPAGLEDLFRDARQANDLKEVLDNFTLREREPSVA